MGKPYLALVTPLTVNGTVTGRRPPPARRRNVEVRAREYLTDSEIDRPRYATHDWPDPSFHIAPLGKPPVGDQRNMSASKRGIGTGHGASPAPGDDRGTIWRRWKEPADSGPGFLTHYLRVVADVRGETPYSSPRSQPVLTVHGVRRRFISEKLWDRPQHHRNEHRDGIQIRPD